LPFEQLEITRIRDVAEMHHTLRSVFHARAFERPRSPHPFEAAYGHHKLTNVALTFCDYSAPVLVGFSELPQVRQLFCLSGASETTIGRTRIQIDGDHSCIVPAYADVEINFGAQYRQIVLHIDADALARSLAHLLGTDPGTAPEFLPPADFRNPQSDRMRRLVRFVFDEVFASGASPPQVMAELEQSLILCFLFANPHNFSHLLVRVPSLIGPSQGRRAESYIEANWRNPVTIEALAAETGTSARSIFRYFKNAHDCTPMEFAKRVRLQRARDMLLSRDPGISVTGVAFACGFQNLGHFARDYRMSFGELPSQTLKGAAH
jgi:AraC-like DNA-binding protein